MELSPVLRHVCFSFSFPYSSSAFPLVLHTIVKDICQSLICRSFSSGYLFGKGIDNLLPYCEGSGDLNLPCGRIWPLWA